MDFKDYYSTLGVAKTATEKEIKQAYRKLARKHHPDVNPGDKKAESRFKDLTEAYEVLGDPAKRKKYNELGANWRAGAAFRPPPAWENFGGGSSSGGRGAHGQGGDFEFEFGGTGFSDFFEQLFGAAGRGAGAGRSAGRGGRSVFSE